MSRILVPVDESEQSTHALEYALEEFEADELVLIHVLDPAETHLVSALSVPSDEWLERSQEAAEELFDEARATAAEFDVEIAETATPVGQPARSIVTYAEENDVDHIVIGSHGRSGVSRVLLGSVAEAVVRRSPVPVTIVH
ncbi:universal stress protein [Halospeciosus flavus]|uniref:Universal stress protein n=1 Tax=Halospeciosus flavus TaxID=3032283 RepID=A0ABD5Z3G9_9EURY|nr:universal stress protein [Halospeciosus flavus]